MLSITLWGQFINISKAIAVHKVLPFLKLSKLTEKTAKYPMSQNSYLGLSLLRMYA